MAQNTFRKGDRVEHIAWDILAIPFGSTGTVCGALGALVSVEWDAPDIRTRNIHPDRLKLIEAAPVASITDLTLRQLQTNLPWSIRYSRDFRASPIAHKDFAHALTHVGKAAGFLHALVDDMDHDRSVADDSAAVRERAEKYIADLVICAMRMANTLPGGVLDLQRAVQHRIESKNGVKLPTGD